MTDKPNWATPEATITHNDAADGFEHNGSQDPAERSDGARDPDSAELAQEPESRRERAWKDLTDRIRIADRLEALTKQLAKLEVSVGYVVSYVNTLALPVRDPLDLPDPRPEYIATMKAAEADIRGRHNLNTPPGRVRFPDCPPYVPMDAGVPHDIGHIPVDPQDTALGAQAVNPNDPIDCVHPNDCQFPNCLCGTDLAGAQSTIEPAIGAEPTAGRAAIESTRGPYAKVYDQNHAEPVCTGAGGESTRGTTLSAEDVCMLRDQAALTEVLTFMDRFAGNIDNTVHMTLTPTEFRAVRHAVAREVGSTPLPDPHPLAYRIPNDMAHVLDSLRIALASVTHSGLPGADVHLSKAELRSLMAVVRGFRATEQLPEPLRARFEMHVVKRTSVDGFSNNDRARKVLHACEAALNEYTPNDYEPKRLLFTADEIACACAVLRQAVASPLKPSSGAPSADWESGKAYWLGANGQFYVLDPKHRVPYDPTEKPQAPAPSPVLSFQTIVDAIGAYWWDHGLSPSQLLQPMDDGWRLTARAADSLASHLMNTLTGAPNWPSPMAEAVGTPARGPEVLSGYDARTRASPPTFVQPFNHASPLHEAIYELSRELEAHQANPKDEQDRTRAIAILMSPAALSIALQACQRLNATPQANTNTWDHILSEDKQTVHIAGDLRQALSAAPFQRAWATLAHLVAARADRQDTDVETLVLRLDAVRGMHKVLLSVRSALLHSGNSPGHGHG